MRKMDYRILVSVLTASTLILGIAAAFYYARYEQLSQTSVDGNLFDSSNPISSEGPNVLITYPPGFEEYAAAILKICDTALSKYLRVFGMSTPDIHVFIRTGSQTLRLFYNPEYRIFNDLRSIGDYRPPPSGAHHVYGFIHEIGHLVFTTDNGTFNQGWADYAAGFRIVPEVYRELGENIWPQPYNYSNTEGEERFLGWINDPSFCKPGTMFAVGKILYTIDQKYGPAIFKQAKDRMHPTYFGMYNYPIYSLEEFKNVLIELTNDPSLLELFSENGF